MIPYYFKWGGGGGVLESKWIMMTAMIQTDYVIFFTVFGTCKKRNYKCQTAVNMGAKYLTCFPAEEKYSF